MKKFHRWLIGISLCGIFISGIASANFRGTGGDSAGGGGLTLAQIITGITGIFAKLDVTNTFVKDQKINDPTALAGGTYSGVRLQTTERASYCLGPSDGFSNETCLSGGALFQIHGRDSDVYDTGVTGTVTLAAQPKFDRVWIGPTGSTIIGGGTGAPNVSFGVGSPSEALATLAVDTTNDWIKLLPISAPAGTECNSAAERGRMFYDSADDHFYFCNGKGWKSMGTVGTYGNQDRNVDNAAVVAAPRMTIGWDVGASPYGDVTLTPITNPTNGLVVVCMESNGNRQDTAITTTGSAIDIMPSLDPDEFAKCTIGAKTDTAWPFWELTVQNTGSTAGDLIHYSLQRMN